MPIPAPRSHKNDRQGNIRDPLAYTRDHVKPKSKGGKRVKPAHRYCNEAKGSRENLSIYFIRDIQRNIIKHLVEAGPNRVTSEDLSIASKAIEGVDLEIKALKFNWNPVNLDFGRWADDGGRVLPY